MLTRTERYLTESPESGRRVSVLLSLTAALFLLMLSSAALGTEAAPEQASTLQGEITAIDMVSPTQSLTLQSPEMDNKTRNIFVDKNTSVTVCEKEKQLQDIKLNSTAQVTFTELAGVAIAGSIQTPC